MELSEYYINKFFENIHKNPLFIKLSKRCELNEYKIDMSFQLDKPIKNILSIWLFIVIYNENGTISYNNHSGDGDATLLESVHYCFYNLNTKKIEISELYDLDVDKALIQLYANLEFAKEK